MENNGQLRRDQGAVAIDGLHLGPIELKDTGVRVNGLCAIGATRMMSQGTSDEERAKRVTQLAAAEQNSTVVDIGFRTFRNRPRPARRIDSQGSNSIQPAMLVPPAVRSRER